MTTLNLSSDATATGTLNHPDAPGSKYGLSELSTVPTIDDTINASIDITNDALISLITGDDVKNIFKGFYVTSGYEAFELTFTITAATNFDYTQYRTEYNASVSVDPTIVNIYVTYTGTVHNEDDDAVPDVTISRVICFHLTSTR